MLLVISSIKEIKRRIPEIRLHEKDEISSALDFALQKSSGKQQFNVKKRKKKKQRSNLLLLSYCLNVSRRRHVNC